MRQQLWNTVQSRREVMESSVRVVESVPGAGTLHPCYRGEGKVDRYSCQEVGRFGWEGDKLVLAYCFYFAEAYAWLFAEKED